MKYFLPSRGCNLIQVASSLLVCGTEVFISEWNKLNRDVRNVETYSLLCKNPLSFKRPIENSICNIYDPLGSKSLYRLRVSVIYVNISSSIILQIP